jgi:hypothetical protein
MRTDQKVAGTALRVLDCGGAPPLWQKYDRVCRLSVVNTESPACVFLVPQRAEKLKVRGENANQATLANN